jgi:hypothetical protein
MRRPTLCTFLLIALNAGAQDWALLNPAYKYNYSDDGTDTISNQIFITEIDTLGPDSFLYQLNRIGVVCDTCPASLGGPCDGCYVRLNQPQFLGFQCVRSGDDWSFIGTDTFMIKSPALVGATWVCDQSSGVTASVDAEWPDSVFNAPDTVRRILLSNGDTMVISRSFGINRFEAGLDFCDLRGVEGPNVGLLFPEPLAYFDYQPGDELVYEIASMFMVQDPGGPQYPWSASHFWKVLITGRTGTIDSTVYTTSYAFTYPPLNWMVDECNWPMPVGSWNFNTSDILADHTILGSYPGQVLSNSICDVVPWGWQPLYLARHGISSTGRSMMYAPSLWQFQGISRSGINGADEVLPGLHPFSQLPVDVMYEEGVGLRTVRMGSSGTLTGLVVELVGAIVDGDTILEPPAIDWDVGVEENPAAQGFGVLPNPAFDHFVLIGANDVGTLKIHDLEVVDVHDLKVGMYVLTMEGMRPKRLVIAR